MKRRKIPDPWAFYPDALKAKCAELKKLSIKLKFYNNGGVFSEQRAAEIAELKRKADIDASNNLYYGRMSADGTTDISELA